MVGGHHAALRDTPPRETAARRGALAVDAHVHLYPQADLAVALTSARRNLARAAAQADDPVTACLLLSETARDDAFARLAAGAAVPAGWRVEPFADDPAALAAIPADGGTVLLVAGRQIVTAEGLEIIAVGMTNAPPDGQPIRAMLAQLRALGLPAILPWGLGKWAGRRGAIVADLVAEAPPGSLLLGDNAGRPQGWRRPPLFDLAAARGLQILPGSDPFPVAGAERGIGRYGCVLDGPPDWRRPGADLCLRLRALRSQPSRIGARQGLAEVAGNQIAFRREKARRRRADA